MVPLLEEVPESVSPHVHEHPAHELFLEVFLLGSVPQLMKHEGLSALDKPVQNQSKRLGAVFLASLLLFALRDGVLLPFLEGGSLVEERHALIDLLELLNAAFLEVVDSADRIPALLEPGEAVSFGDLLIAATEHQGQLCAEEPLLSCLLSIQVGHVVSKDLLLDAQRFQELGHFLESKVDLSHLLLVQNVNRTIVFRHLNSIALLLVLNLSQLQTQFSSNFGFHAEFIRVLTVARKSLLQDCVFEHVEEVGEAADGVLVEVVFTGGQSDSLEDFDAQGAAGDGADHVDGVAFAADVLAPGVEHVAALFDVDVGLDAVDVRVESFLEPLLALVSLLSSLL